MKLPVLEDRIYSFLSDNKNHFFQIKHFVEKFRLSEKEILGALDELRMKGLITKSKRGTRNYTDVFVYQYKSQPDGVQEHLFI